MKLFSALAGAVLILTAVSTKAQAKVTCWTQYGGTETCEKVGDVYLDKRVSLPRENNSGDLVFKDNLSEDEAERYEEGQLVVFEIRIKNIGDANLHKVRVDDRFPAYLEFVSGDGGWDSTNRIFSYEVTDLDVGEEETRRVTAKVVSNVTACVYNTAEAFPNEGTGDIDTAKLCLGKRVLGVTSMPKTGMNAWLWVASLAMTGAGLLIAKKH